MKDNFEYLRETLKESDFNGHTSFQSLTFTQKLTWLSEAVESVYLLAKDNPGAFGFKNGLKDLNFRGGSLI